MDNKEFIKRIAKEFHLPIKPCPECDGEGMVSYFCGGVGDVDESCPECRAKGYLPK